MRAKAQRAAVDAAVAMRVTMNDALDPIVRQLGRVTTAGKHEREALAEAAIPMVLDSAAIWLAPGGYGPACSGSRPARRGCWFPLSTAAVWMIRWNR